MTTTYKIYQELGLERALFDVGTFVHSGPVATLSRDFYVEYPYATGVYYLARQKKNGSAGKKLLLANRT